MRRALNLPRHAALGLLDEADQMRDVRQIALVHGFERADRGAEVAVLFQEQLFVGELD